MIYVVSLMIAVATLGGEILEELDEQFREEFLEIVPEDYSAISTGYLFEEAAIIADRVYSPFSEMFGSMALSKIASIPAAGPDILEGMVLKDSIDFEGLRLLDFIATEDSVDLNGYLYLLRFWDPSIAASYSKSFSISWLISTAELGGRTICERIAPDQYYLLDGDDRNPIIAIVSLRDVFTAELELEESGCYSPVIIKWYERDTAD